MSRYTWDATTEIWYLPILVSEAKKGAQPLVDATRTLEHGLGFVPIVWISNLPGGTEPDGAATFKAAISSVIEMDYQVSQAGRALRYAADPKLVIRDPSGLEKPVTGGAGNALVLTAPESEAKLLEISGGAAAAVESHVKMLRGLALESINGNRADHEKLAAAQSGRAMELMCQSLVQMTDKLRTSYGEVGLISLLRMVCMASSKVAGGLLIGGKKVAGMNPEGLALVWPPWFAPTPRDRKEVADTMTALTTHSLVSEQTGTRLVGGMLDIEDVVAERKLIAAEQVAADARLASQPGVQTKATEVIDN